MAVSRVDLLTLTDNRLSPGQMSDSPQPALSLWPDLNFTKHFEGCMSCCSNEHERVPIRILRAPSPERCYSNGTEIKRFKKHVLSYPVHHEDASHDDAMHHNAREGVPVHWSANDAHHRHRPPSRVGYIEHNGEAHQQRGKSTMVAKDPSPQRRSPSPQRKHLRGEAYHGPKITALPGGGSKTEVGYVLVAL